VLPGKTIPMWFQPNDFNAKFDDATKTVSFPDHKKHWEIACAVLCGGGHYRMRGKLVVFETKPEFDNWLKYTKAQQESREPEKRAAATEE
jgi:heme/copper-type cytochrome/quinol oxidase subunit 2